MRTPAYAWIVAIGAWWCVTTALAGAPPPSASKIETPLAEPVRLETTERNGTVHHGYRGKWFSLHSTADDLTTRRLVVRMEQVFSAYRGVLPPRTEPAGRLTIEVHASIDAYGRRIESLGLPVGNRAVYFQTENLVIAGSELGRYASELDELNARHAELRNELKTLKRKLPEELERLSGQFRRQGRGRGEIRRLLNARKREIQRQIDQKLRKIESFGRRNEQSLARVAGRMLERLDHEAFHAYFENYVFPGQSYDVPRWLNEGLALVVEGGVRKSGTPRLGPPNRDALGRLKNDLAGSRPLSVSRLLEADAEAFFVAPGELPESSRRYYDYAWGLASYLAFERRVLKGEAFEAYVARSDHPRDPLERFEELIGIPLPDFERAWHDYLRALR